MTFNDSLTTTETFKNVTNDNTSDITNLITQTVTIVSSTTSIIEAKPEHGSYFFNSPLRFSVKLKTLF